MRTSTLRANLGPCAGLILATLVWAAATQFGLILPYADCGAGFSFSLWLSLFCLALSLVSAAASLRIGRDLGATSACPRTHRFVRRLSALFALALGFSLALQTLASALLSGCER